jgi:hypothetical protein
LALAARDLDSLVPYEAVVSLSVFVYLDLFREVFMKALPLTSNHCFEVLT